MTAVVEKALFLLELLAASGKPASLAEVTEAAGLPKPTAYRLLQSLLEMGYVARPPHSRDYLIGPRAARLAGEDPHAPLKNVARPLLRWLHEEFNETVNLGALSGQRVVYLEFIETTKPLRFVVAPGESDPYFCTALGRAIVAGFTDEQRERLLEQTDLHLSTASTVRTKGALRQEIEKTRKLGFAEEHEEAAEGVCCLGISLGSHGFPAAAISVAVPAQRFARQKPQLVSALNTLIAKSHARH